MVYLPPEILGHIVDFVTGREGHDDTGHAPKLAPLATINNVWQSVVESRIWHSIVLNASDLFSLRSYMASRPTRRRSLRKLRICWTGLFKEETNSEDAQKRFQVFINEEKRFNNSITAVWGELASWKEDLMVTELELHFEGGRIYDLLGPPFRKKSMINMDEILSTFENRTLVELPSLQSVKTLFSSSEHWGSGIDIWTATRAISVSSSLPQLLTLSVLGSDEETWWPTVRKHLREDLAAQLRGLPSSLRELDIQLPFVSNFNQDKRPPNLFSGGTDLLSRSLREASRNLTSLALQVSQLSPELFWPAHNDESPIGDTLFFAWQNLKNLAVSSSIETAAGNYCLLPADPRYPHPEPQLDQDEYGSPGESLHSEDLEDLEDSERQDRETGQHPVRLFRIRPDHGFFNDLAISVARAASRMPKLESLTLVLSAPNSDTVDGYRGYALYFRIGNGWHRAWCEPEEDAGIDQRELSKPRLEWVFQCPEKQLLGWAQPEEASRLWREKTPDIELDVLTFELKDENGDGEWRRKRDEVEIGFDE